MPEHKGCQEFLRFLDLPIAAPSANISKHTSPVTAKHVYDDLNGKINLILDGGKCEGGIESTVLDVTTETPTILRSGLVTADMIKRVVGKCEYSKNLSTDKLRSPGCKYSHYNPKCKTAFFDRNDLEGAIKLYNEYQNNGKNPYYLCDNEIAGKLSGNILNLGATGKEIASNLYDKLLEGEKIADIIIGISIDTGTDIDIGIMNRFTKACTKED